MVYEAREGQTFMLGASTWRIEEITRDRVLVSPAPGVPGRCRSGRARGSGGRTSSARGSARLSRELSALSDESADEALRGDYHLDELAAKNLLAFLREQERSSALPTRPDSRRRALPRRDRRLAGLHPDAVRRARARALVDGARRPGSATRSALEVQSLWSDDGIALHLPDADAPPAVADLLVDPDEVEDLVVQEVGQTALFGSRFRENAARALLIPRRRPGQRTPLWQQRLKAQSLLEVARRYGSFPIVLETYRECLQDVFDLPALRGILRGLATRELDLVE